MSKDTHIIIEYHIIYVSVNKKQEIPMIKRHGSILISHGEVEDQSTKTQSI